MKARRFFVAGAVLLLTLLTFVQYPGSTYLQSDTQIYIPILERLADPSLFANELLAQRPHVSFTIYDEAALLGRRLTGLDFQTILVAQQFVFRALGILGVFLLAAALQLSTRMSLLVAGIFALGAAVPGPTVMLLEYEPVPRGFAIPLLLLALGLAAHGRDVAAGCAAALAFLYHPPSVLPFWAVYFVLTLWPTRPAIMKRRILGLLPVLAGVVAMLILSRHQPGVTEPQEFFSRIDPFLEKLQRMRASYIWVSLWPVEWLWQYLALWAASLLAFWRVRKDAIEDVRFFLVGLPLVGVLSMPLSYVLLEQLKWTLAPQLQAARALVFVAALAIILGAVAAVKAGQRGSYWETVLWFLAVFSVPAGMRLVEVAAPDVADPAALRLALLVLTLAMAATVAVWAESRQVAGRGAFWAAAVLLPFVLLPMYGPKPPVRIGDPALQQLAAWARASTDKDAVFLFPDAFREIYPGVFRAEAQRAVYVDWKAGGQVNFLRQFALEWWSRWEKAIPGRKPPKRLDFYGGLGVDYVAVKLANRYGGDQPVFENEGYAVYRAPNFR